MLSAKTQTTFCPALALPVLADSAGGRRVMGARIMEFEAWKGYVDGFIAKEAGGLTSDDLPDCNYRDWYEDDATPRQAARRAIRYAKGHNE